MGDDYNYKIFRESVKIYSAMLIRLFWTIWIIVSVLLLGTLTISIEITNGLFSKGIVYVFLFGVVKLLSSKSSCTFRKSFIITTVFFGLFLIFDFFLDWRGDWKTQTIVFQNKHLSNRTIEFQLQDKGSFGYNKRTVDRIKIAPFVSWIEELNFNDLETIDSLTWEEVNIYVNEQELKGG